MRARPLNTSTCTAVAPACGRAGAGWVSRVSALAPLLRSACTLVAAATLTAGPAACGGSSHPSAVALSNETFSSHGLIRSGTVELYFGLSGSHAAVFSIHLSGPFESAGTGRFPRFALAFKLLTGGRTTSAGAVSTGGKLYLDLGGSSFRAPASAMQAIEAGYAQGSGGGSAAQGQSVATLGIDPAAWFTHPVTVGRRPIGGVQTIHILARLDAARFLQDAGRLSSAGALLAPGARLPTPEELAALSSSLRSARVDLYTGAQDHRLRGIAVGARVEPSSAARASSGAPAPGTLAFALRFSGLNQRQSIVAPARSRPPRELAAALERLAAGGAQKRG